jgi:ChaB.
MPYNTISELPPAVKKLSEHEQKVWLSAFNSAFKQSQNEEQAFKIAWAAVEES